MKVFSKVLLISFLFILSLDGFATRSLYNLTVNFADNGGNLVVDPDLALKRVCISDTITLELVHKSGITISNTAAAQINWVVDFYNGGGAIYLNKSGTGKSLTIQGGLQVDNLPMYIQIDSAGFGVTSGTQIFGSFYENPIYELGNDLTSCVGLAANLRNLSSGGPGGVSYLWSTGATSSTLLTTSPGTYSITVTNFIGTISGSSVDRCLAIDKIKFSNYPLVAVEAGGTRYRCFGESLQLNAFFTAQSTPPNYTYNWQPSLYLSQNNIQNPVVGNGDPLASRTYTVTVTDANLCRAISSVTVIKNPQLSIKINQNDTTLCKFTPLALPTSILAAGTVNSNADYQYRWLPTVGLSNSTVSNPNAFGISVNGINYVVTVTDLRGCTARDTVNIKTTSLSLKFTTPVQEVLSICSGEMINTLQTTRKGGLSPFSFTWSSNPILIKTSDSLYSTSKITSNQKIVAQVNDGFGCFDKDSILVIVKESPVSRLANASDQVCTGNTKQISVLLDAEAQNYNVRWSPSPNPSDTSITSYKPFFAAGTSESSVRYIVTITSIANNCPTLDTLDLSTKISTDLSINSPNDINDGVTRVVLNSPLTFSASQAVAQYTWSVINQSDNTNITPATNTNRDLIVSFINGGLYNLSLVGVNSDGCVSNASLLANANNDYKIFAPTVFSPAAEKEENKSFRIFYGLDDIESLKVSIFNVQGQKVFESTDKNKMLYQSDVVKNNIKGEGWTGDGYPNGQYTWVVEYKLSGGKTERLPVGTVTLVR